MPLVPCPECGKEVSENAVSCPNCGTPFSKQNKKFCQHCGEQIDKDCIICPKCGKQVETFNKQEPAGSSPIVINNSSSASAAATAAPAGGYVRTGRPVNKIVYCLLAFFLGSFGIHKFFTGKIGTGIVYLLFCWTGIPAFIAVIESIIGLCKPADEYGNIWF